MNLTTITTWIKNNLMISILVGVAAIALLFPKVLKGLFGPERRKVHHRASATRMAYTTYARRRRALPRSVGMHKVRRHITRRSKGSKKPWQIKGSLAARRHMALIRKRK
jgi:hypothetical protein